MQAAALDFGSYAEHSRRAGSPSAAALQRPRAILAAHQVQAESQATGFGRGVRAGMRGAWQWLAAAAAILGLYCAVLYLSHTVAPRVTEPAVAAILIAGGEAIGTRPSVRGAATQADVAASRLARSGPTWVEPYALSTLVVERLGTTYLQ
jgi:hypothetical protein